MQTDKSDNSPQNLKTQSNENPQHIQVLTISNQEETKEVSLKDASLLQILQLLENLSDGKSLKFPKFNEKLTSLFQNAANLQEFKDAKSLKDILELSKKFNLGLEKISFSKQFTKTLQNAFPNLAKDGFFELKQSNISSEKLLNFNQTEEPKSTDTLKELLKTIDTDKSETKEQTNQPNFSKTVAKTESLNIKSVNTRQTLNTFAQDFKEQVEQYKPPIMKVKLSLNPKALGEMDVTLVNRGNNLQVSINSNTQAMNLFLQNQTELKNSLVNMGFTGLEMNFSNQKNSNQNAQSNGGTNSYNHDEEEILEATEDTILEITLPDYA